MTFLITWINCNLEFNLKLPEKYGKINLGEDMKKEKNGDKISLNIFLTRKRSQVHIKEKRLENCLCKMCKRFRLFCRLDDVDKLINSFFLIGCCS